MKSGKAAGPSGIVTEMLTGIDLITKLVNSIVGQGVVPSYWEFYTKLL